MALIEWEMISVGDERIEEREVWDVPYRISVSDSSFVVHVAFTEVVLRELKRRFEMIGAVVSPAGGGVGVGVGEGAIIDTSNDCSVVAIPSDTEMIHL